MKIISGCATIVLLSIYLAAGCGTTRDAADAEKPRPAKAAETEAPGDGGMLLEWDDTPKPAYEIGEVLFIDDFEKDTGNWSAEIKGPGTVAVRDGKLDIDVSRGSTTWFKQRLEGAVMIEYVATVIGKGGENDRVSDLNCFWMAIDPRSPDDIFESAHLRRGGFGDYHILRTYYVGYGGHNNTKTRFRRYVGDGSRPLLPEHDLTEEKYLITPNAPTKIQLVACGQLVRYIRNGEVLFEINDPKPYTGGWFAFRTVNNHMRIDNFRVYRLKPAVNDD